MKYRSAHIINFVHIRLFSLNHHFKAFSIPSDRVEHQSSLFVEIEWQFCRFRLNQLVYLRENCASIIEHLLLRDLIKLELALLLEDIVVLIDESCDL